MLAVKGASIVSILRERKIVGAHRNAKFGRENVADMPAQRGVAYRVPQFIRRSSTLPGIASRRVGILASDSGFSCRAFSKDRMQAHSPRRPSDPPVGPAMFLASGPIR